MTEKRIPEYLYTKSETTVTQSLNLHFIIRRAHLMSDYFEEKSRDNAERKQCNKVPRGREEEQKWSRISPTKTNKGGRERFLLNASRYTTGVCMQIRSQQEGSNVVSGGREEILQESRRGTREK